MLEHLHIASDAMNLMQESTCPTIQQNRLVIGLLVETNSHRLVPRVPSSS